MSGDAGGPPSRLTAPPWRQPDPRVWVVLPAYNEAENLPRLLPRIEQTLTAAGIGFEVIVVDDGSRDDTAAVAERHGQWMPLILLRHPSNLGLGATIRDGLREAARRANDDDVIVSMDGDNSHGPELIPRMRQRIAEGCDVVIASRYQPGAAVIGVPRHRRWLSTGARWLMTMLRPIPGVRDYTCGYRAYRGAALKLAFERYGDGLAAERGFQAMAEILLKTGRLHLIFDEVPLILRYDWKTGQSKMKVLATVFKTLRLLLRR